jgi:pyruvate kinase
MTKTNRSIPKTKIVCTIGPSSTSPEIGAPSLTKKDSEDLLFGLENSVDYVAVSFVRSEEDILRVREIIRQEKKDTPIIAKIEKHEAIEHMEELVEASAGTTNMMRVKRI